MIKLWIKFRISIWIDFRIKVKNMQNLLILKMD